MAARLIFRRISLDHAPVRPPLFFSPYCAFCRHSTRSAATAQHVTSTVEVGGKIYTRDDYSNVTAKILSHMGRNLHLQPQHPLSLIKQNIVNYMYGQFRGKRGLPLFSVHDQIDPVVTTEQNFDSLLVPRDHVSRSKSDSYYINREYMLRAHTSAHQSSLIRMGLDNFMVIGDVYRRDEIDSSHYPVFHQVEGVRLLGHEDLMRISGGKSDIALFESGGSQTDYKQEVHTVEAAKIAEVELKNCLMGLARHLFGGKVQTRWVEAYFPFTHPSWELEVLYNGSWLEVLGCGVMQQEILSKAGAEDRIGWAFGLGLERLAMVLYSIPDIRLFWSTDSGFLNQFEAAQPDTRVVFKEISKAPQCINDISFWLPKTEEKPVGTVSPVGTVFSPNDFYDLVRSVGGDMVEQVKLIDEFHHPKKGLNSQCYRIIYRDISRVLTQEEVNKVHSQVEQEAVNTLGVTIR